MPKQNEAQKEREEDVLKRAIEAYSTLDDYSNYYSRSIRKMLVSARGMVIEESKNLEQDPLFPGVMVEIVSCRRNE